MPSRLAIVESDPLRVVGYKAALAINPCIVAVETSLEDMVADESIEIALVRQDSGLEALMVLLDLRRDVRFIIVGASLSLEAIARAISRGVCACLAQDVSTYELCLAVECVRLGAVWLSPRPWTTKPQSCATRNARQPDSRHSSSNFTGREREILKHLVLAESNREIGRALGIGEQTVKTHIARLMRKVGVHNRTVLSMYALRQSSFNPEPE